MILVVLLELYNIVVKATVNNFCSIKDDGHFFSSWVKLRK